MSTTAVWLDVAAWIGQLGITAAAAAGFAYWLFQQFAQNWIKSRFDNQLEQQKAEYQRELERLRFQINTLMDRATKLHSHEYQVLPTAWGLLQEAYGTAVHSTSAFQQHADLENMTEPELEYFLAKAELAEHQKDELRYCQDKNKQYGKMRFWINYSQANRSLAEYNNFTLKSGIFIEPALEKAMLEVSKEIHSALIDREFAERYPHDMHGKWAEASNKMKSAGEAIESIKLTVHKRLWDTKLDQPS